LKIFLSLLFVFSLSFASDATIEVIKKVDALPSLAIEDSSMSYSDTFQLRFFKALVADMNVLSIYNVDRHHRRVAFDASDVLVENKDIDYVLRYQMSEGDDSSLNIKIKLLKNDDEVLNKSYKVHKNNIYMFISHTIAYDINHYMGEPSVGWMKRKVIFSRIVAPKKSEIVIADYTLSYQHVMIKGGYNIFPKWADKQQHSFYYTALDGKKPTLKYVDIKRSKIKSIISSDGMMVCSDVNEDGSKLLLTMARNSQPDIYLYDVRTHKYKRETFYHGIDVGGHFKGRDSMIFISDRLGYPNVFSRNSNSACSTHGEYIVYKARESSNMFSKNSFNLHLISTQTDFIRRLTATGVNEFPEFSKDGDAIIFIKNYKAQSSIGIIRLNHNKNYLFPMKYGRLQSMDW